LAQSLPFGLFVTGKGKRQRDMEKIWRDRLIAREVAKLKSDIGYDKAIDVVHEWLPTVGMHLSRDAVEKAYKAWGTKARQSVP